ncbi:MAG TPA: thioredoxin-like domain-containing protein [Opitutaceae bacterium]|nr:thioredoxin-like domain-containing protein [Opitutaceae bacterium]
MKRPLALAGVLAVFSFAATLRAETWRTVHGESVEGTLSGVYGPLALIAGKQGSAIMSVEKLDDAALGRVADFLARPGSPSPAWNGAQSKVGKALRGRLSVLRDGKLVAFEPGTRAEPEFYLVYFGAYWCGPCRRFSPSLVEAYGRLKQRAGDRFEVVFISSDHDGGEMLKYVREVKMPWPVLKYSAVGSVAPLERWAGRGIPCLVALTRDGDLLFHSYRGEEYLGPLDVLQKFEALLGIEGAASVEAKRAMHRLAIVQHVRAAAGGNVPAKPYVVSIDLRRYQTLAEKNLTVTLDLDEKGQVVDAEVAPKLPAVVERSMVDDAGKWLFLPAVEKGEPVRKRAVLPVSIH